MRISVPHVSSRHVLIILMLAHIVGTLFAYTVYISVSSLGDGYKPHELVDYLSVEGTDSFSSTLLTFYIYYFLGFLFPGFYAPMVLGIVIAIITWFTFRDVYKHLRPFLFFTCNLFPHFLVWSSASSKEQLVILSGLFVINFAARRSFNAKNLNINLIFVLLALSIIYIIRPNYFVIYFVIFTTALFSPVLHKIVSRRLSVGVWVFVFSLLTIFVLVFLLLNSKFLNEDVVDYMTWVQRSFLAYETAGSNRYNIQWNDINDFFYNSIWGIPQGFIGPTLLEGLKKPLQFPAFLEGLLYFTILGYLFFQLLLISVKSRILRVHILPFMYVSFIIVFVSYPFLIFNPGSALRYKQSMHPVLILYPLLILAYYRANYLITTKIKKKTDEY